MKKKVLLLAGLCTFGLCTWEAQAMIHEHASIIKTEDNVPSGYDKIILHGDLILNAEPDGIVAGVNDNSVYIHFNRSFGNVNICIYNATGNLIYSSVVDTSVQQTVIIPISSSVNGTFTVVLNNANGYAEGNFEHN